MSLGERMREMRKMLRLSQEELAFRLGTNRVSVSQWENNRVMPDADSLIKTAAVLGTSVGFLLGETDDPALSLRSGDNDRASPALSEEEPAAAAHRYGIEEDMLLNLFNHLDRAGKAEVIDFIQYKLFRLQNAKGSSQFDTTWRLKA
ncbi:helix-turn-helix transcriptional regulator [Cloacibacillus sp.]|uniref:helix-turn-helix domain-containing protein n=1 Tax=Cloacibacillus sp. TaxID=2049023 RepID=UPI0025BD4310|nr:helix-turn-helix transcriptional regulator [Cloacibacillus sp.]MCC8057042.1 helix-turn-helix domain-containing protein [Cloacibacillus sp.]